MTDNHGSAGGIELVSPILQAIPGSDWRQHVEATWKYLTDHYNVSTTYKCSTHIHISLDPFYTTLEIKRIAQAVIHFETAFEALVPPVRRSNSYAKSNWLDSPYLANEDKSRSQLITEIEKMPMADEVTRLMQKGRDRDYAWNFWAIFGKRTIEFRKPPASTTAEEVLSWAELALSFIQASVKYESTEKLQRIPATVGGLRWFVSQFIEPGVNEPARMQRIWAGMDPTACLAPIPNPTGYWQYEVAERRAAIIRLARLAAADERQIQRHAATAREPYW
jgi:Putative amidoligase enzyme